MDCKLPESFSPLEIEMVIPLTQIVRKVGAQSSAHSKIGSRVCVQRIIEQAEALFPGEQESVRRVLSFVANALGS